MYYSIIDNGSRKGNEMTESRNALTVQIRRLYEEGSSFSVQQKALEKIPGVTSVEKWWTGNEYSGGYVFTIEYKAEKFEYFPATGADGLSPPKLVVAQ